MLQDRPPIIWLLSAIDSAYSTRRFLEAAHELGIESRTVSPRTLTANLAECHSSSANPDARHGHIIPRIGVRYFEASLRVLRHLELCGWNALNRSRAIAQARDKWWSMSLLTRSGFRFPPSTLVQDDKGLQTDLELNNRYPVILKTPSGTRGIGVMLATSQAQALAIGQTVLSMGRSLIVQKYLDLIDYQEFRIFVLHRSILVTLMRQPKGHEFRSNHHCGGEGAVVQAPDYVEETALNAAQTLGLDFCCIDLLVGRSSHELFLLDVNATPGFQQAERLSGRNLAGEIIQSMLTRAIRRPSERNPFLAHPS